MPFVVSISATQTTSHESALVTLSGQQGFNSELYFDFTELMKTVHTPSDVAQDFLLVAETVYALDKLVSREQTKDAWSRSFDVTIPVKNPETWQGASRVINDCLSFLSGDHWNVKFDLRTADLIRRKIRLRAPRIPFRYAKGRATCLFSGGLDSLIGAIDWLEENPGESLALVGHHDWNIGGALSDQLALLDGLQRTYPNRITSTFVGIGHSNKSAEITMRSRSLLFLALGSLVADQVGAGTPLLIPENGTISLNVPLTPSRRGSCSTRTTHPHYLDLLGQWLSLIGLIHPLVNPLLGKTKGAATVECRNPSLLQAVFRNSISCAKRGHTSSWINRQANGCGRCMPCIYRRAALHAAALDDEVYGVDICAGEVDWTNRTSDSADDFRACLSFLIRNPSQVTIAKMLIANGHLRPLDAMAHAATVQSAMHEIRNLLRDKAIPSVRAAANIR